MWRLWSCPAPTPARSELSERFLAVLAGPECLAGPGYGRPVDCAGTGAGRRGDCLQPRRRLSLDGLSSVVAAVAPQDVQLLFGSGDGHMEQAALLSPGCGGTGVGDGHEPVLQAHEMDDGPLQSLGGVEGHQVYTVR